MKLVADENISPQSVASLRNLGFDILHVREIGLRGKPDKEIMDYASKEGRVLEKRRGQTFRIQLTSSGWLLQIDLSPGE